MELGLSTGELHLLLEALENKLWSLTQRGMARTHPRYVAFNDLRSRIMIQMEEGTAPQ